MRKVLAAGIAALGLVLAFSEIADAALSGGGRGGGGFRSGGGFRGGGFRGGFRGGIFVGPGFGWYDPFWWPYDPFYYPFAYPYLPPEAIGQYAPPPGYLPEAAGAPAQQYWYRCGNPEGYYPYVRACNGGWEQVPVAPPGAAGAPPAR